MKKMIETILDSRSRQTSTPEQGSRQMMPQLSRTNNQEHPSRYRGQSVPPSRGSCAEASSFGLFGCEVLDGDPHAYRNQTQTQPNGPRAKKKNVTRASTNLIARSKYLFMSINQFRMSFCLPELKQPKPHLYPHSCKRIPHLP